MAAPGPSHTFTPALLACIDGAQQAVLNRYLAYQVLLVSCSVLLTLLMIFRLEKRLHANSFLAAINGKKVQNSQTYA